MEPGVRCLPACLPTCLPACLPYIHISYMLHRARMYVSRTGVVFWHDAAHQGPTACDAIWARGLVLGQDYRRRTGPVLDFAT
ncbi:hypothetical protein BO71DRAFT_398132 [Aspergillus ellipticus CBS 707.79]|uniref:Uncharacterized protein n=1 Tax=Aspergillus ellipticus CBS 707.79 TaxID=1448320 RepID=A0A319DD80_9EURO|nr:hypothetical protein BO71DRAFT_398132 [Aspergillus ellipticus CBS 707.79]